ncbi:MAG: hypothetical protein WBE76_25550 [Terracidiphilus sp.]
MQPYTKGIALAMSFAAISSASAYSQKTSTDATTSVPVAGVYIQGPDGVYVYDVSAAGKLTTLKGSPFWISGQMGGVRGSYLISEGTDNLRTYKIESNGALGGKVAEIDTQKYGGSQCGTINGSPLLDRTGQYFAVSLYGGASCAALQTYKIASNGAFTFLGDSESAYGYHGAAFQTGVSTYSSNDLFAYGIQGQVYANGFLAYKRGAAGDLVTDSSFTQTGPTPNPSDNRGSYEPVFAAADPANHLAAVMNQPFGPSSALSLASYTIDNSTGAITSTNTYLDMPVLEILAGDIAMSWGGNLLAVGGVPGLQLFHFNGAAPATAFGGVLLPKVVIDQVAWDKNNHLFALSLQSQELYVFTVTPTSITEAPGSPYKADDGTYSWNGLMVVPKS